MTHNMISYRKLKCRKENDLHRKYMFLEGPAVNIFYNFTDTGKPMLRLFLLRRIRFNTNYNLQPSPPIAHLNCDLTRFFKIKCQKYVPHPSNTYHIVQYIYCIELVRCSENRQHLELSLWYQKSLVWRSQQLGDE